MAFIILHSFLYYIYILKWIYIVPSTDDDVATDVVTDDDNDATQRNATQRNTRSRASPGSAPPSMLKIGKYRKYKNIKIYKFIKNHIKSILNDF